MRFPKRRRQSGSKYKNTPLVSSGMKFDSVKEATRYRSLSLLQKAGVIQDLTRQVSFLLVPTQKNANGKTEVCVRYVADFVYMEKGCRVVEDVKSDVTRKLAVYIIKRKLMLQVFGITIREV